MVVANVINGKKKKQKTKTSLQSVGKLTIAFSIKTSIFNTAAWN